MLIYNPLFDARHCVYRFLSTIHIAGSIQLRWDAFKILDLLRMYPSLISNIHPFPRNIARVKKSLKNMPKQYTVPKEPRKTLYQLQPIHNSVSNWLIAKGFISKNAFLDGYIIKMAESPAAMIEAYSHDTVLNSQWYQYLVEDLPAMNAIDFSTMKQRTGYMEFRYDPQ